MAPAQYTSPSAHSKLCHTLPPQLLQSASSLVELAETTLVVLRLGAVEPLAVAVLRCEGSILAVKMPPAQGKSTSLGELDTFS